MKLLNNFVSRGYASIYAEALMLGTKAGLTPQVMDSVLGGGRMDCGFYQMFFAYALENDDSRLRFALKNAFKDMTYLASFAQASGPPIRSERRFAMVSPLRLRLGKTTDLFRPSLRLSPN